MAYSPQPPSPDGAPNLDSSRARQGGRGTPVLLILVAALVLAAVAWFGAELYGSWIAPPNSDQSGVTTN